MPITKDAGVQACSVKKVDFTFADLGATTAFDNEAMAQSFAVANWLSPPRSTPQPTYSQSETKPLTTALSQQLMQRLLLLPHWFLPGKSTTRLTSGHSLSTRRLPG